MATVEQIEAAILQLPSEEFHKLAEWLMELHEQRWDKQIELDAAVGKLDKLAGQAVAEFHAGRCRPV